MKYYIYVFTICTLIISPGCKKKKTNTQPIDQYNIDGSNDYRYIFRDTIKKSKWKENRYEKDRPFRD